MLDAVDDNDVSAREKMCRRTVQNNALRVSRDHIRFPVIAIIDIVDVNQLKLHQTRGRNKLRADGNRAFVVSIT